jgi:hypothetical protein
MPNNYDNVFASRITPHLGVDDAPSVWRDAVSLVIAEAEFLCAKADDKHSLFAEIGCCSNWMAPHHARWTADGGFAWPSGYSKSGFSLSGLPEFDWSLVWVFNTMTNSWSPVSRVTGKRPLVFRVALPARTARHRQAVVHTIWKPGPPPAPKQRLVQFYGFRKTVDGWECTATKTHPGSEAVYE